LAAKRRFSELEQASEAIPDSAEDATDAERLETFKKLEEIIQESTRWTFGLWERRIWLLEMTGEEEQALASARKLALEKHHSGWLEERPIGE
jgi:hypothetical protein